MGQYRIVAYRNSALPILVANALVISLLLFIIGQVAFVGYSLYLAGSWIGALAALGYSFFCLWWLTGPIIEMPVYFILSDRIVHGQYREIDRCFASALSIWELIPLPKSSSYLRLRANRALIRMWLGDYGSAELEMREIIAKLESKRFFNKSSTLFGLLLNNLSCIIIRGDGDLTEAEQLAKRALTICRSGWMKTSNTAAFPFVNLATVCFRQGRYAEAEEYLKQALPLCNPGKQPSTVLPVSGEFTRVNALLLLSLTLFKENKQAEALAVLTNVMQFIDADMKCITLLSLDVLTNLSDTLIEHNHLQSAEKLLDYSYAIASRHPDHCDGVKVLDSYTKLLTLTNRESEIADMKRWIRPVLIGMHI
jgi:tetratricopeptide (TPR) repeat protein